MRDLELLCSVPAGLIEDDDGVGAGGNLGGDLVEMKLHGLAVAEGKNQRGRRFQVQGARHRTSFFKCRDRIGILLVGPGPGADVFECFIWKCVASSTILLCRRDARAPGGAGVVGAQSSRACMASMTASCCKRGVRRSLLVVHCPRDVDEVLQRPLALMPGVGYRPRYRLLARRTEFPCRYSARVGNSFDDFRTNRCARPLAHARHQTQRWSPHGQQRGDAWCPTIPAASAAVSDICVALQSSR